MPSYTTSLRLIQPSTGEYPGDWGNQVNSSLTAVVDKAVAGTASITMTTSDYTLTNANGAADEAKSMFLVLGGTPGAARNVICPAVSKLYYVTNNTTGGFAQTVKTASGSGISVPNGASMVLRCDGTNVVEAQNSLGSIVLNGGTANGVAYLNASKALTTGSALVFDGTNLGVGTSSPGAKLDIGGTNNTVFFKNSGATTGYALATISNTSGAFQYGISSSTGTFWGTGNAGNYAANIGTTSATNLGFGTSDTLRMVLDSSGNLGVGTSSPAQRLDVAGAQNSVQARFGNVAGRGLEIGTALVAGTNDAGSVLNAKGATSGTMIFQTDSTERARITSGGYFKASNGGTYVSSTGPYHELRKTENNADWAVLISHAGATAANQFGTRVDLAGDPNGASNEFLYCSGGATLRASIRSNGGLANYSANDVNLSDRREKTNFAPAKSYLDTICAIPVQTFNYIDQSPDDPGLTLGVVAQDVQAVAPELVMESNWGTEDNPKMRLSIYQTDLQYALMKCIQEQQALITDLRARVAALEQA